VAHPWLRVRVTAGQWNWSFTYANGKTVNAISTWSPPVAEVPVGVEVEFDARSEDVIHGFYVPTLRFQRQVFPGYVNKFDLIFTKPGTYTGECSVYCGTFHSYMHFAIRAVSATAFRAWVAKGGTTS
jgi:cytochrome c oxidase subunit II